jgi:purine-nucleoside phosphorylase
MVATLPDLNALAGALGLSNHAPRDFFSAKLYEGALKNREFCLTGPFIGAPHATILLENLVTMGVDTVIFIGWCGSVSPMLEIGDVLLATAAFSDEGTSRHYGVSQQGALLETNSNLNALITSLLEMKGICFKTGKVWTTDAIYRETPKKIDYFREKGAMGVEMELSAMVSVAAFRGIRLTSMLTVSDEVGTMTWKPGFGDPRFKAGRKSVTGIMPFLVERILYG